MARTLFRIPFASRMSDEDLLILHRRLDMVTYLERKPGVFGAVPGIARLDPWSALYLVRGEQEDRWALEARTWGDPPAPVVRAWLEQALLVARELDPRAEAQAASGAQLGIQAPQPEPEAGEESGRGAAAGRRFGQRRRLGPRWRVGPERVTQGVAERWPTA